MLNWDDNLAFYRQIEEKFRFVPEYFYAKHPCYRAPIRILVNRKSPAHRRRLGDELRARGFVVKYWRPNGYIGVE